MNTLKGENLSVRDDTTKELKEKLEKHRNFGMGKAFISLLTKKKT